MTEAGAATGFALRGDAAAVSPVQRMALYLAGLGFWQRQLAAFLLGALAAAALPPVDLAPVLLISFPGLVWLADADTGLRAAFALGWSFGLGFFLAGLYWITVSLFVDIAAFWWLVPFAVTLVPAGLAIFTGAALAAHRLTCRSLRLSATARIFSLVFYWAGAEWLRGHIFTGFPWNLIGYAWSGGFPGGLAMVQTASLAGIYGLSLLTVLAAALPARLGDFSGYRRLAAWGAVLLIAVPAGWGAWRLSGGPVADVPDVTLRLVQPSIPETMRDDPSQAMANFRRLFALSTSPGLEKVTAVLWPEDAAPPFLDRDGGARQAMAQAAPPNGYVVSGTVRTDPAPLPATHVWNSLVAIDRRGAIRASYDKSHLVPFGEYVPLRGILPMQNITGGTVDFSAGTGPKTIALPGLPPFSPLICYEAIFPGAVVDPNHRPAWLFNITNDAWYGFTSGPFQHVAIARVRSVEEGLPMARVGNNGISVMFDPYGRVLARLSLNDVGFIDEKLPVALPPTLYSRVGDVPFLAALGAIALGLLASQLVSSRLSTRI